STPTFTINAPNSDILLSTSANNFSTTPIFINNGNIRDLALRNTNVSAVVPTLPTGLRNLTLTFNLAPINLPALTISNNLTVSSCRTVTQSVDVISPGTTTLSIRAANNITLDKSSNNFGMVTIASGNNITLADLNSLILGNPTISGALNVTT